MTASESPASSSPLPVDSLSGQELWRHPNPESTTLHRFKTHISEKYNVEFGSETDANSLWQWSIDNINAFWTEVWDFTGIRASKRFDHAVDESLPMFPRPTFFPSARLNFAENLLFPTCDVDESATAVITATEFDRAHISWKELREQVRQCAAAMKSYVSVGDRVAGYLANDIYALVAMLAATSLGAVWTGISPDHGATAVLDRLEQLEPALLFVSNAVFYNGRAHDTLHKLPDIVPRLPSLKAVVVVQNIAQHPTDISTVPTPEKGVKLLYSDYLEQAQDTQRALQFEQLPADHPVYILFSSGTTGKPKCICHGAIGTLIQHKKEHYIQTDMKPGDVFFQFTTVTWMMWHWLVSGLASGLTIVLYDGSPFRPLINDSGDLAMSHLIAELGVHHFGTSAKYLSMLEQNNAQPPALPTLKTIMSTAAPLAPSTFSYIYRAFRPNIHLASITGGTDIISLFGAPSTLAPVYAGEIQALGLGMAVRAFSPEGEDVSATGEPGDLVCTKPFPCQPVCFWGPQGEMQYRKSYFAVFGENVWHHGDFCVIGRETKGLIMLGRSDGILKPAGVRFGSAEIYNVLLRNFAKEIEEGLCIGRRRIGIDADETVVLFVKMSPGYNFTPELVKNIKERIRAELSIRHVPGVVDQCFEIPVTSNGKKVEVAVKQILCGLDVRISASVANGECLEWYREWAKTH